MAGGVGLPSFFGGWVGSKRQIELYLMDKVFRPACYSHEIGLQPTDSREVRGHHGETGGKIVEGLEGKGSPVEGIVSVGSEANPSCCKMCLSF